MGLKTLKAWREDFGRGDRLWGLLLVVLLAPSLVWIFLDCSLWPWDQAWYGQMSVDLWETLVSRPDLWPGMMIDTLRIKAPGTSWLGQFFVPVGRLIGNSDAGLLLSIVLTQWLVLLLVFKSLGDLTGGNRLLALTGAVLVAAP